MPKGLELERKVTIENLQTTPVALFTTYIDGIPTMLKEVQYYTMLYLITKREAQPIKTIKIGMGEKYYGEKAPPSKETIKRALLELERFGMVAMREDKQDKKSKGLWFLSPTFYNQWSKRRNEIKKELIELDEKGWDYDYDRKMLQFYDLWCLRKKRKL